MEPAQQRLSMHDKAPVCIQALRESLGWFRDHGRVAGYVLLNDFRRRLNNTGLLPDTYEDQILSFPTRLREGIVGGYSENSDTQLIEFTYDEEDAASSNFLVILHRLMNAFIKHRINTKTAECDSA